MKIKLKFLFKNMKIVKFTIFFVKFSTAHEVLI